MASAEKFWGRSLYTAPPPICHTPMVQLSGAAAATCSPAASSAASVTASPWLYRVSSSPSRV